MPKSTFFNLSEVKRERIIESAINNFAEMEYNDVTVSKIVKDAQIPKGSFYQYFEDKYDLYYYIVNLVGEKKKTYFTPVFMKIQTANFFDLLGEMYKAGVKFAGENPKMAEIGTLLIKTSDQSLLDRVYGDMGGQVEDFLGPILQQAIAKGELREDIDIGFLSYMFGQFNMVFADYFFKVKKNSDFEEYVKDIDMMLDLFKHGAMKKS